jgi:RHS repeat-associated protein
MEARNINSDLINKYVYGYNKVHMKMFEERGHDSNKGDVYDYDEFQRLTNVKFNSPEPQVHETIQFDKSWSAQYDKVDNILNIVETENQTTNEITPTMDEDNAKLNQYTTFDQWGLTYDQNGNTTQKGTQDFTYDYRIQLVSTTDGTTSADYKYDALGRRVQTLVTSGAQTDTFNYYYSGNQVIEERDGSDAVLKQYIYGNGIDELLIIVNFDGAAQMDYYVHTNSIGSVTAITDQDGNLVERVSYDTFGMPTFTDYQTDPQNPTVVSDSLIGNDILFQGRRYDEETNLYYYRARYYDPIMGRFLQTDPMGYKDSMNMYQAFNQNPMNFVDPFGLSSNVTRGEILAALLNEYATDIVSDNNYDLNNVEDVWHLKNALSFYAAGFKEMGVSALLDEYKSYTGEDYIQSDTLLDKIITAFNYLPNEGYSAGYDLWTAHLEENEKRFSRLDPSAQIALYFMNERYKQGCGLVGDITGSLAKAGIEEIQYGVIFGIISSGRRALGKYTDDLLDGSTRKLNYKTVNYKPNIPPFEHHHGVLDVWATHNVPGYTSRGVKTPTILLTSKQHEATKKVYREWLFEKTGRKVGGKIDWKKVSPREIQELVERMFNAAKVPEAARREYSRAFHKYIYR